VLSTQPPPLPITTLAALPPPNNKAPTANPNPQAPPSPHPPPNKSTHLLSVLCVSACAGVPIVCFPIWHWYMLRGDWL